MNDEYIRKDVFDAELRRVEEVTGGAIQDLRDRIDDLKSRIDDLKDRISELNSSIVRGWTVLGVVATIAAIIFAGVQWYVASKGGAVYDDQRVFSVRAQDTTAPTSSGTPVSAEQTPAGISVQLP